MSRFKSIMARLNPCLRPTPTLGDGPGRAVPGSAGSRSHRVHGRPQELPARAGVPATASGGATGGMERVSGARPRTNNLLRMFKSHRRTEESVAGHLLCAGEGSQAATDQPLARRTSANPTGIRSCRTLQDFLNTPASDDDAPPADHDRRATPPNPQVAGREATARPRTRVVRFDLGSSAPSWRAMPAEMPSAARPSHAVASKGVNLWEVLDNMARHPPTPATAAPSATIPGTSNWLPLTDAAQERMDAQWEIQEDHASLVAARGTPMATTPPAREDPPPQTQVPVPVQAGQVVLAGGAGRPSGVEPPPVDLQGRQFIVPPSGGTVAGAQGLAPALTREPENWVDIPLSPRRPQTPEPSVPTGGSGRPSAESRPWISAGREFSVPQRDRTTARPRSAASPSSDESTDGSRTAWAPSGLEPHELALSQPPPARLQVLRTELEDRLGKLRFSATAPQQVAEQMALQAEYLNRAAQIAERREAAFGTTQPYRVAASMTTQTKEGSLAAVYGSFQSFVTSSFRSPSGGATGLSLRGNRNVFVIDQALITAIVQGALAYAAEGAMTAMNNRATLSNMPKFARNKFEDLFYEQGVKADTVLLVVKDGTKEFMRAGDPRAPTPEALAERATRKLSEIRLRQDLLDGKSFAFPLQPLLSGGFNTLRRFISSAKTLSTPAPLFVTSALASGSASAVVKLSLELGKTRAQVQVDDLVGGQQTVNLFRLGRSRAEVEPVRWSDAGRLLGFLRESARESLALAGEAARTFGHSAGDMAYRYMLVNGIANVTGVGFGGLVGQLFREGRHFGALPGESPQSRASIAGQMAQSTFGDALWRGLKEVMKGRELDANASLALRRATAMAEQLSEALSVQLALREQAAGIPQGSALWAAQGLMGHPPGGGQSVPVDVEAHGNLRNRLCGAGRMDLATLQNTRAELAALDLREATPQDRTQRDSMTRKVDKLIKLLTSHAANQQWLAPRN